MIFLGKERDLSRQEPKDGEMLKADSCSLVPEEVGGEDLSLSLGFMGVAQWHQLLEFPHKLSILSANPGI